MTALELIDQMLSREVFSCTKKQMELLRDLVSQGQDIKVVTAYQKYHSRKVLAVLKREVTNAKRQQKQQK